MSIVYTTLMILLVDEYDRRKLDQVMLLQSNS